MDFRNRSLGVDIQQMLRANPQLCVDWGEKLANGEYIPTTR